MNPDSGMMNHVQFARHAATGLMVARDGSMVYFDCSAYGLPMRVLDVHSEAFSGLRFVNLGHYSKRYVKDLVAEAFGLQQPAPGYVVEHLNGVNTDDRLDNLCWMPRAKVFPAHVACANAMVAQKHFNRAYQVYRDGRVKQGGRMLGVRKELYDRDMDLRCPLRCPTVRLEYKNRWGRMEHTDVKMDYVMFWADYVNGNPQHFDHPVILHRDGDLYNFHSDNLEWCDEYDPRYIAYYNSVADMLNADARRWNSCWPEYKDISKI